MANRYFASLPDGVAHKDTPLILLAKVMSICSLRNSKEPKSQAIAKPW